VRLVFLGAPGVGKGTQAKKIATRFDIPHISTGDILRKEIKQGSELGEKAGDFVKSGNLVPDDLIIDIIKKEILEPEAKNGFIFDGFPRTQQQAVSLDNMLASLDIKLDRVINIVVDEAEIVRRLTSRRVCSICNHTLSIGPDDSDILCPLCSGKLTKRKDDEEAVIKKRLEVYKKQTSPLIKYYEEAGLISDIDGLGEEQVITERIMDIL
jgi:adenylate kinase